MQRISNQLDEREEEDGEEGEEGEEEDDDVASKDGGWSGF